MIGFLKALVGMSLASITLSSPLSPHPPEIHTRPTDAPAPCMEVKTAIANQPRNDRRVSAQLAYDCITSVPFNQPAAKSLVDSLVPYLKWHSTTSWLKNPPKEYVDKVQRPYNMWAEFQKVKKKVSQKAYKNEYEFGWELYSVFHGAHDGHLIYVPDVVGTVFNWARPLPLVSVSRDGQELPQPYIYADILREALGGTHFKASPVTEINGQSALHYLEDWAQHGGPQDRDASYNNVFYSLAAVSIPAVTGGTGTFTGKGRGGWVYPGPTTELKFANGTRTAYTNYAKVLIPFDGIRDGESLYRMWFSTEHYHGNDALNVSATAAPEAAAIDRKAFGYPPPTLREDHNLIRGYFLDGDYSDVAVLAIPSFVTLQDAAPGFQDVATKFLDHARSMRKKKLVIDLSGNGGGIILLAYDMYKLLFPTKVAHAAADRFRAFESTYLIGEKFSAISETLPRTVDTHDRELSFYTSEVVSSEFNYQSNIDVNEEDFSNWQTFFGPKRHKSDTFTNLFRWNLSDVLVQYNSGGVFIHGYGPLKDYTQQPFAAEDIIVVTDGYCASSCAIFAELMRQRAGVKFISLGGRSRSGLTQAVGGTKGTNDLSGKYIQALAEFAVEKLSSSHEEAESLMKTELGEYFSEVPFRRLAKKGSMTVNFRDGIRDKDIKGATNVPLQFIYEDSDCRILYTPAMTYDATEIWKAVADTAWGHKNHCVAGRIPQHGRKMAKRDLTAAEQNVTDEIQQWRAQLSVDDYPMELWTDVGNVDFAGSGFMTP